MTELSNSVHDNAHYNVEPADRCPWCGSPRKARGFAAFTCGVTSTTVKPSAMRPTQVDPEVRVSDQTPICRDVARMRNEIDDLIECLLIEAHANSVNGRPPGTRVMLRLKYHGRELPYAERAIGAEGVTTDG